MFTKEYGQRIKRAQDYLEKYNIVTDDELDLLLEFWSDTYERLNCLGEKWAILAFVALQECENLTRIKGYRALSKSSSYK